MQGENNNPKNRKKIMGNRAATIVPTTTIAVTDWMDGPFNLPARQAEFAIGDVHGCTSQLEALLSAGRRLAPGAHLTMLGDLIDRGPDSIGAIQTACAAVANWEGGGTLLPGNHEALLMSCLQDEKSPHWVNLLRNGGEWAIDMIITENTDPAQALLRRLGEPAMNRLTQNGELMTKTAKGHMHRQSGNVIFVHAGVPMGEADPIAWIESKNPLDVVNQHPLWIREGFFEHKAPFGNGMVVVHGHTPEHGITRANGTTAKKGVCRVDRYRLGLDTGCFKTNIMSGAIIESGRYRIITATSNTTDT